MIFHVNPVFFFISAMIAASLTDAFPLVDVRPPFPKDRSPIEHISPRVYPGRLNQNYHRRMHSKALHARHVDPMGMLKGREVTARQIASDILGLAERRNRQDLDWTRRSDVTMSHEDEMACRERGGTPQRITNGRAGCSMNPVPIRRTVWRKRKGEANTQAGWEAGDGHGR